MRAAIVFPLSGRFASENWSGIRLRATTQVSCGRAFWFSYLIYRNGLVRREVTHGQLPFGCFSGMNRANELLEYCGMSGFGPEKGELVGSVLDRLIDTYTG